MKKTITRRHFLAQMTSAGSTALLGAAAVHADFLRSPQVRKPYRPSRSEQRNTVLQQQAYEALVQQPVFQSSLDPHWLSGGERFWYRRDGPGGTQEFIGVDAVRGRKQPAFDHARLAASLTQATGTLCEAASLPFSTIEYTPDASAIDFPIGNQLWQCDLSTYLCTRIAAIAPEQTEAAAPTPKAPTNGSLLSPDGRWAAFIQDANVRVRATDGTESALTQTGTAAQPFGELNWAPDSRTLAAFQINPAVIKDVYMVESSPPDGGTRGVLHAHPYAQPGDPNTTYALRLCDPAAKTSVPARIEPNDFGDVPALHWSVDGDTVLYEKTERGHQRFRVFAVHTRSGETRTVIDERAKTFINTSHAYSYTTQDGREIIYASEQDGWRHLYLVDALTGAQRQITQGEWVVREVDRVDEAARQIWFQASGKNPGQDPYLIHFYRIGFDGAGLVALTTEDGSHSLQFSPDRAYCIDTYSRADLPPVHTLRRSSDGFLLCPLETADVSALSAGGWNAPKVFRAKGRDGSTDIWGLVFRPSRMNPALSYPIIENIYAGPHDSFVRKTFAVRDAMQSLADLGFIVVQCDGMGTRNRSKAFHDVCWHNVKDAGLPDRIAWMKALALKYPYCDTRRVGIYGTSAGGQSAAGALLFHPEFYRVAVASCGCHDNRIDKQWWNEQWMGYPVGPWYADNSNITHASALRGRLLLIVGELDTNVPPESTLRFADHLIKAGKDFDLLVLPGLDHTSGGAYGERRRRDYFLRHLLGVEPPDRNLPAPPIALVRLLSHPVREERFLGSAGGGEETTIQFRNATGRSAELFWLSNGKRTSYGTVPAGGSRDLHTYAGHAWLVMEPEGIPREIFVAAPHPGIAEIAP